MKPLPLPNISPQPSTQNAMVEQANTMKFFDRMFVEFLTRQNPVSTHAKPRFMKNTSIAVTNTQIVSSATLTCGSMPSSLWLLFLEVVDQLRGDGALVVDEPAAVVRSEEHTSELQSQFHLAC